jgi:glycerophosphoryl diester phosphodiesterase
VPYLAELFEEFPQARFNVDVKEENAIQPLAELIRHTAVHDRVCVASFSVTRLRRLRALLGPRVATSLGGAEVAALRLSSAAHGPAIGATRAAVAAQVPHKRGPLTVVTDRFLDAAHAAGLAVHVWTVNDADEIRTLLDRGVDGIITDRPDVLRDVLDERGQWHPVDT